MTHFARVATRRLASGGLLYKDTVQKGPSLEAVISFPARGKTKRCERGTLRGCLHTRLSRGEEEKERDGA